MHRTARSPAHDPVRSPVRSPARFVCWMIVLSALMLGVSCRSHESATAQRLPAIPTTKPGVVYNDPPPAAREFRAAWVATVGNIDWPSKPGLDHAAAEGRGDRDSRSGQGDQSQRDHPAGANDGGCAVRFEAGAVVGIPHRHAGEGADPYYDPLQFWIAEAHKRGIELHAWFNPFRTKFDGSKVVAAANHVSRTHPEYAHAYGKMGWMDPGEQAAQDHSFDVFMDVVERYDVDGIHIDDYFYPYPEKAKPDDENDDKMIPFPDDASYKKYTEAGGKLDRADWRRQNITKLIERIYEGIKGASRT